MLHTIYVHGGIWVHVELGGPSENSIKTIRVFFMVYNEHEKTKENIQISMLPRISTSLWLLEYT